MCYCRLLHKDGYIVFSFWSLKSKANSWFPRKRYYRTNSKQLLPKVWCFLQTARVPWSHNTVGSHQVSLLCIYTVVTRGIALIQGMLTIITSIQDSSETVIQSDADTTLVQPDIRAAISLNFPPVLPYFQRTLTVM